MEAMRNGPMSSSGSQASYDRWHDGLEVDAGVDSPWHIHVRRRLEPARDLQAKRVLEIGCGRGGFACWLASHALAPAEVVAADFSANAIAKGRDFAESRGIRGIRWELGDIQ
ncbi:MAG: SAM-dependent methyltransferase, partial [Rhodanobacter sp.]